MARESDPTLLRLCFVVLIPVFGLGIVLYGLAWLVLQVDEEMRVPLPKPSSAYLFGIGLLSTGSLLGIRLVFGDDIDATALPSLVIVAGVLFIWGANGVGEPTPSVNLDLRVPTAATSAGLLLVVVGLLGVLQLSGVMSMDVASLASLLLVGIGIATIVGAFGKPWPGLVLAGALLAFYLGAVTLVDTPVGEGIGDRTIVPVNLEEIAEPQQITMGSLVLDLTQLDLETSGLPGSVEPLVVSASVMVGDLRIILPEGVSVAGDLRVGTGKLLYLGETQKGFILDESSPGGSADVILDLRVGLGSLVVDQEFDHES